MKKYLVLALVLLSGAVKAEVYLDLGMAHAKSDYSYDVSQSCIKYYGCSLYQEPLNGPVGIVELGYTYKDITFFYNHTSLILKDDARGLNMLGMKLRIKLIE